MAKKKAKPRKIQPVKITGSCAEAVISIMSVVTKYAGDEIGARTILREALFFLDSIAMDSSIRFANEKIKKMGLS